MINIKQLPDVYRSRYSTMYYLCTMLGLSPRIVVGILCDRYIPGGQFILQHPEPIIQSYNNYLRLVKAEKGDEFNTEGSIISCNILKSRTSNPNVIPTVAVGKSGVYI